LQSGSFISGFVSEKAILLFWPMASSYAFVHFMQISVHQRVDIFTRQADVAILLDKLRYLQWKNGLKMSRNGM
jgi:hypothetical protein